MTIQGTPSSPSAESKVKTARTPSEVQLKMARTIVDYLCRNKMNVGNHVTEQELVEEFHISRSPVRAAMAYLAERGVFEQRPNRGFFVQLDGVVHHVLFVRHRTLAHPAQRDGFALTSAAQKNTHLSRAQPAVQILIHFWNAQRQPIRTFLVE